MQSAEDTADDIAKLYRKASGYLSDQIDQIFSRFRRKHHLTEAEAYRLLNMMHDKTSIDELKTALKAADGDHAGELLAELESPAYRARIERFQQLQNELDLTMRNIYQQEKVKSTSHYVDLAKESYYRSIFDIQQRTGIGFDFALIDPGAIDRVVNSKWLGANYSTRIWHNTQALSQDLKEELLINLVTGRTDREAAEVIANKFAQGASNARRLVRTESCNLANQMEMESYEECGIEYYRYVATLDLKTSTVCRGLDGKRFPVKEQQPGKNCPPMHPWCRSTTICDISDIELAQMQRRARDPVTGKTKMVSASTTYEEWYQQHAKRQDEKLGRLADNSLDDENQKRYQQKEEAWKKRCPISIGGVDCAVTKEDYGLPDGRGGIKRTAKATIYETQDGTKFVFPEKMNRAKQKMTPEKAIELWQKVPEAIRQQGPKTIEYVDYYNPQDSYWKKKYKNFTHSYATGGDKITFYRHVYPHDDDYVVRTYCHESGHYIDRQMASTEKHFSSEGLWTESMKKDIIESGKKSPTLYGENAPAEDFAESIAEYVADAEAFKKSFPNRADLLNLILGI